MQRKPDAPSVSVIYRNEDKEHIKKALRLSASRQPLQPLYDSNVALIVRMPHADDSEHAPDLLRRILKNRCHSFSIHRGHFVAALMNAYGENNEESKALFDQRAEACDYFTGDYFILNPKQACHFLLNVFYYACSDTHFQQLPFSQNAYSNLFYLMNDLVLHTIYQQPGKRDMSIVNKLRELLGLPIREKDVEAIPEILALFAQQGADIILGNVRRPCSHFDDFFLGRHYFTSLAMTQSYAASGERYEMQYLGITFVSYLSA